MVNNKNEYYQKTPIRLILSEGTGPSRYLIIIYEKDGLAGDLYISLNGIGNNERRLNIPYVHFVDDESVVVWKTTIETGIFSGEKKKTELSEVRINRNFQSKI